GLLDVQEELQPSAYKIEQNYPNPFNPSTTISYFIPTSSFVILKVYDILGNEIRSLVNEEKTPGNYQLEFNAANLPTGIYFYRLQAGSFIETRKMVLMK
ncbi:MAG: T9SS type A sorting domain-containing protein, partial [Ignavibacteriaceae bacterium]|nr:T9SS type A sorting domain-containing protein [Ignavibacteriaceae bacterium]